MKYLCLVYSDEKALHPLPGGPDDKGCHARAEKIGASGKMVAAEARTTRESRPGKRGCTMAAEMEIALRRLPEVDRGEIIALMNHPLLARHMPLLKSPFTESDCEDFLATKERLWAEHGYGPWALMVNGRFAGWGGFQPEDGEVDLGMVLHPDYWGHGAAIYEEVIAVGFDSMGFESVTVLLPVSRTAKRTMHRLGFLRDGEVELRSRRFLRYRLDRSRWSVRRASRAGFTEDRRPGHR